MGSPETSEAVARRGARLAGLTCVVLGSVVLAGWALDVPFLTSLHPTLVSMKANTAICFALLGFALWSTALPAARAANAARACAASAASIAGLTLGEHALGWDLGIDQLLFDDPSPVAAAPGRMGVATAIGFVFSGSALALIDLKAGHQYPGAALGWLAGAGAFVGLVGYTYGVTTFWGMAVHTVAGFLILTAGIVFARPQREPIVTLLSATDAGKLARRLLPLVIVIPAILGWLRLWGERQGYYDTPSGVSLLVVSSVLLLDLLTAWATSSLRRSEVARGEAHEALAEREKNLATTLDSIGDAVIVTDRDGLVTRLNPVAEQLTGWSFAEAAKKPLDEVFRAFEEETGVPVENPAGRVLREGTIVGLANHTELESRDGTRRPIAESAAPVRSRAGTVSGAVLVFRDVTSEREHERALQASEARNRSVLESALDAIVVMDGDGFVVAFNAAAESMIGCPRSAAVGRRFSELAIPPPARAAHEAGLERLRTKGESRVLGHRLELTAMRADGTEFPAELSITRASAPHEPSLFTGFIRDLSERREAARIRARSAELEILNAELTDLTIKLDEANRELESFSYSASHDLRAPLRAIDGFSRIVLGEHSQSLDADGHELLRRIRTAAQHMGQVIDDLLRLASIGRAELRMEELDLSALTRVIAAELAAAHPERTVHMSIADDLRARADPGLLRRALQNLLENAWKFSAASPEPCVEVAAMRRDDERVFYVKDNGAGFDMRYAGRLFTPFQRLHRADDFPGTGVGLATVERVIRRHGGRVWAESRLGDGATFYFTLGAADAG